MPITTSNADITTEVHQRNILVPQGTTAQVTFNWISRTIPIATVTAGNPTTIVTAAPHRLTTNDKVILADSNCYPNADGYYVATVVNATTLTVPFTSTENGTGGSLAVPVNLTGYTWDWKIGNSFRGSAGVSGLTGATVVGDNKVLLNTVTGQIEPGDRITVAGSGLTDVVVLAVYTATGINQSVLEVVGNATTAVAAGKVTKTGNAIASFVVTTVDAYGEITGTLSSAVTTGFPIQGDATLYHNLFYTLSGAKGKLAAGEIRVVGSVL